MSTLREQFHRPELAEIPTLLQRRLRRARRLNLVIATAIARAHVRAYGTECEVDLYHRRTKRVPKREVTIDLDALFSEDGQLV